MSLVKKLADDFRKNVVPEELISDSGIVKRVPPKETIDPIKWFFKDLKDLKEKYLD